MQDEETIGPVIGIVLILAIIFFGGLFAFLGYGQQENEPVIEMPINKGVPEETATASEIIFETEPAEEGIAE
ncbi:MAG: hypothetical protein WCZ69_02280 [Candidatus Paceibacterota bacterium]|jgi:hypothetical protein